MSDPVISRPRAGLAIFRGTDTAAAWSQAAHLIGFGVHLSGDYDLISELRVEARELLIPEVEPLNQPLSPSDVANSLPRHSKSIKKEFRIFNAFIATCTLPTSKRHSGGRFIQLVRQDLLLQYSA